MLTERSETCHPEVGHCETVVSPTIIMNVILFILQNA